MTAHLPVVDHDGVGWRATCACGWSSIPYRRTAPAHTAANRHKSAAAATAAGDAGAHRCHFRDDGRTVCDGCGWVSRHGGAQGVTESFDHVAGGPLCRGCWHRHTGPDMGGICIGCPCPPYDPLAW